MYDAPVNLELKAKMFRGFADPTRLSILESLRSGEKTVNAISDLIDQSQSNVSNHLSCLKECGLVVSRREGKNMHYSIASTRVQRLLNVGDLILDEVGDRICRCVRYNGQTSPTDFK